MLTDVYSPEVHVLSHLCLALHFCLSWLPSSRSRRRRLVSHPGIAFIILWFLILWLAMMEGCQGASVVLQPIDKDKYVKSPPCELMNTRLAHTGDNMERFIVGHQFFLVWLVFVTNLMASTVADATVLGFLKIISNTFLSTVLP